jgi:6-phospho-beta-glucosidase
VDQTYPSKPRLFGDILDLVKSTRKLPGLPFDIELVLDLQLIPNEYLFYYYYSKQAVENILSAGISRGEQITLLNSRLFTDLRQKYNSGDFDGMLSEYHSYIHQRGETYMLTETGKSHDLSMIDPNIVKSLEVEGYAGVALNLIEALIGGKSTVQYLNIANRGAMIGMDDLDVVEIPALVSHDNIQPLPVGTIPDHCLGLIKQVKSYEHLTIEAALENSYQKALLALTTHPLVGDFNKARLILNEYIEQYVRFFPKLN